MLLFALAACTAPGQRVTVTVAPELAAPIEQFAHHVRYEDLRVEVADDPVAAMHGPGLRIALVEADTCAGCYTLSEARGGWVVEGDLLGRQYGLAEVMEAAGFRFYHPNHPLLPEKLARVALEAGPRAPEMALRGLQLHTLHPLEGLYDLWMPGDVDRAAAIVDWVVKNRGNHLQWVGLDDVTDSATAKDAWSAHTAAVIDEAHARGLTTSVGVQLYGSGNLQQAFDLLDGPMSESAKAEVMTERFVDVLEPGFDGINLSFGEFFAEEPAGFIADIDLAYEVATTVKPDVQMSTLIHVGADLRVQYDDQDLIYYFLATYANPAITPHVHTVMYFDLFDPTLGAYHHEDFSEHRQLLLDRLAADQPVAYFPESAYWVAFDDSVPVYLPIYAYTRWIDLDGIRAAGTPLGQHVLFSSGWEWGYWQGDYATLRMNYTLPTDWRDVYRTMLAPYPPELAETVADLAEIQRERLILGGLSSWLAGRDVVMEIGYDRDIVSQPVRPMEEDVVTWTPQDQAALRAGTLADLEAFAAELSAAADAIDAVDADDPFVAEMRDGARVTALRAAFVAEIYLALLDDAEAHLAAAVSLQDEARTIVARRHGALHSPLGSALLDRGANPTAYQFGYLHQADTLCFWEREAAKVRRLRLGSAEAVPGCAL